MKPLSLMKKPPMFARLTGTIEDASQMIEIDEVVRGRRQRVGRHVKGALS